MDKSDPQTGLGEPRAATRREFLHRAAVAGAVLGADAAALLPQMARAEQPSAGGAKPGARPVIISSSNGLKAIDVGYKALVARKDPLDAAIESVTIVEDDPDDSSVGYGGLPNEDGIVELDASVMHGPTHKAGAVASLRNIRNPAQVARLVMQRTDHVLIVGEGALRFAKAHGFKEQDLLTEASRQAWLKWKESRDKDDDWLSDEEISPAAGARGRDAIPFTWGTIHCAAVDSRGDLGATTTTSGLSYKIPGRVGDSPILGAGLYVDNAVGAVGSTGRGEANLLNCSSFLVVELMRHGKSPQDACLEVIRRVADHTEPRLRDKNGRPAYGLILYALAKDGRHGSAAMWSGAKYAVCDETGGRLLDSAFLYKRD